jgi:leader peptidase (prepilin peptidase)/N-methyltransferase
MTIAGANKRQSRSIVGALRTFVSASTVRPISIVVAVTVAAAGASFVGSPDMQGILGALLAVVTILIAFFDWRGFIIPDWLNAAGFLLGLVHAVILTPGAISWALEMAMARALVAAFVFLTLRVVYAAVRGRQGLGLGDVKLAAVAGAWLDWSTLPMAIELAASTALCAYVLRQLFLGRRVLAQSRIPFGFFFAPAIWICWLYQGAFFH